MSAGVVKVHVYVLNTMPIRHFLVFVDSKQCVPLRLPPGASLGKMAYKTANGMTDKKEEDLTMMRHIARSSTVEQLESRR